MSRYLDGGGACAALASIQRASSASSDREHLSAGG